MTTLFSFYITEKTTSTQSQVWFFYYISKKICLQVLLLFTHLTNDCTDDIRVSVVSKQTDARKIARSVQFPFKLVEFKDVAREISGILEQGLLVRDLAKIRRHYRRTTNFKVDLLSLLPTDLLYLVAPASVHRPYLRFNRLIKATKMNDFFDIADNLTDYPNVFRLVKLVLYVVIMIHWNACVFMQVSIWLGLGSDDWVYCSTAGATSNDQMTNEYCADDSLANVYVYVFYWSTIMLSPSGDMPMPETTFERIYAIVIFAIGMLIFASLVGNFSSMLDSVSQAKAQFQHDMDAVKHYVKIRNVDRRMETKIVKWFNYMWENDQSMDNDDVLSVLPETLRAEIAADLHMETLRKVTIFQECEPSLLAKLVVRLSLAVFSPGDYICRKGDVGTEMYFVKRGRLEVVSDDGKVVYATLNDGSFFGEVSILPGNMAGSRRTADVRSVGYSDLCTLSKDDMWAAIEEYPEAKAKLIEIGRQRLPRDAKNDGKTAAACANGGGRNSCWLSLEKRVGNLEADVAGLRERFAVVHLRFTDDHLHFKQEVSKLEKLLATCSLTENGI